MDEYNTKSEWNGLASQFTSDRKGYPQVRLRFIPFTPVAELYFRFHAIYFPAFLMALNLPLPRSLLSHSHWTVNKTKMSKSLGNVVDPMREIEDYGIDTIRWYLARVGGRFKDDVG